MKKILALLALATSVSTFAANFVQLEQENVSGRQGAGGSTATYLRAGKDLGDYSLGLQSRTAKFDNGGGIANSLETTIANKNVSAFGITPFVGMGHDFGGTGGGYNYGLVGATAGAPVGPGFALVGIKTRVGRNDGDPKQTVGWVSYAHPIAKNVALTVGLSRSGETIKERGVSAGVSFGF